MSQEQVKNIQEARDEGDNDAAGRGRSTIQFPYNDLDEAVSLAKAVHDNAGLQCTVDQLAGYLSASKTSGTFRLRMSTASTFGITDNERGEIRLTPIGRRIVDPAQEAGARADAFLHVPLYARVFENYSGFTLPGPAALEKYMRDVGVSPNVTNKARQVFMRSAKQAGFFAHGEDRLVRPAGPGTKPIEPSKGGDEKGDDNDKIGGNGGAGGGSGEIDPIIRGLLVRLPKSGNVWPEADRKLWLQLLEGSFKLIYKEADDEKSAESKYRLT